jgi:hypothetical protein
MEEQTSVTCIVDLMVDPSSLYLLLSKLSITGVATA